MKYTKEKLKELGFVEVKDEHIGIIDFVNKVTDTSHLILSPTFNECFIWILDDEGDEFLDGTKILINTSDLEQAISLCKIIVGVDNGF
mgnify:CR=1 FL=1